MYKAPFGRIHYMPIINKNMKMNSKMYGNITKNHATHVAPDLQIIFKIHVQNKMYMIFTMYIKTMFEVLQE